VIGGGRASRSRVTPPYREQASDNDG